MNRKKAIKLAIKALETRKQSIAIEANLHRDYGANYPAAVSAFKEYNEIEQAITLLEGLIEPEPVQTTFISVEA